jgi:hypothetical protein
VVRPYADTQANLAFRFKVLRNVIYLSSMPDFSGGRQAKVLDPKGFFMKSLHGFFMIPAKGRDFQVF